MKLKHLHILIFAFMVNGAMVSNAARAAGNDVATSAATKPQVLDTATVGGKAATAAEAVDMGGSVLWAPWNMGAARAEEYGAYFE